MPAPTKNLPLLVLAALALLCLSSPAYATVIVPMDVQTLSRKADLIVRATAQATSSAWTADRKLIHSVTRLSVSAVVKGEATQVVDVRAPGGTVGDLTQLVSGAPKFAPGEEVILFLDKVRGSPAVYTVTGFSQGKFTLAKDPRGQGQVVTRPGVDVGVVGGDGQIRPQGDFPPVAVEEFVRLVREAAAEKKVAP